MLNRKKKLLDDVTVWFEISKIHFYLSTSGLGPLVYEKRGSSVKIQKFGLLRV